MRGRGRSPPHNGSSSVGVAVSVDKGYWWDAAGGGGGVLSLEKGTDCG